MINSFGTVVEVARGRPDDFTLTERPTPDLSPGQVIASIDRFALTANNATYALFGEAMGYYGFFPASEDARGVVPVWGFATITQSGVNGVNEGTRLYGFWPFASHVLLEPTDATAMGFSDGAAHRQALHSFYNMVSYVASDPFCQAGEALVPALKPLFATAWLLEDFFAANAFFGAEHMLLTSASSKTALGTAYCLKAANRLPGDLIGLTSACNKVFVEGSGLYDSVVTYDEIGDLADKKTALVDFAGNPDVLSRVHGQYCDLLTYSCQVGKSHSGTPMSSGTVPGPQPVLFFAPDQAKAAMKRLGPEAFQKAQFARWQGFSSQAETWFEVQDINGLADAAAQFVNLVSGAVEGSQLTMVSPG